MKYGEEWPLPMSLCYKRSGPECTQMLPDGQDMLNSVAINIFRTPAGNYAVTERGTTATFIPHKKADEGDVSGFAMTNEQFIYHPAFDPHQSYHTYTISLTPGGISFYIDAPGGGFDISGLTPVQAFNTTEYPDLKMFGPQMPGGQIQWTTIGGQQVTDPGKQQLGLGFSQMMMNIWIAEGWGGTPGRFKTSTTYVKRVAFRPLDGAQGPQIDIDFTTWSLTTWFWPQFRELFMAEQATDGTKSAHNVDLVKGPDGKTALRLLLNRRGTLKGRSVYQVAPGVNAKVTLYGSNEVIAYADYPHYDVFPFPTDKSSLDVWVTKVDEGREMKCGYRLTANSWSLVSGRGDLESWCSFMPHNNEASHLMRLPDETQLVTLAVG
eukprot:TRINITY_DN5765_c0_g2_i1.p1 TRINITY_DN5765_c0_g2~~TRINITY_DN5765_c0_g2_i1.p1  ORF type:complete len:379 (+),score=63.55 TRINITY_DN5765_c0_g2_i1:856-1992(+)